MKTFKYNFEQTRTYYGKTEIEAETQEEADAQAKELLEKFEAGDYDEIGWHFEDTDYTCEELEQVKAIDEQEAEFTITIHNSADGDWMYDIYKGSIEDIGADNDIDSLDGGACTGSMKNALEMASHQALELYKRGAVG